MEINKTYNMADYFGHWLSMKDKTERSKLPNIFFVNWFQKDSNGSIIWPGFSENSRVLEWIFRRSSNEDRDKVPTRESPIGYMPDVENGGLNTKDLNMDINALKKLFHVDPETWKKELSRYEEYHHQFGSRLPKGIQEQHERIKNRLE
jgi:phosphoenolpyruvate carboxykinase (GTP)